METIHYISSDLLSIEMINEIVFQGKHLALSEEAIVNIEKCRKYLDDKMKSNSEPIYGINTGFGSLCNVKISNENLSKLQENLVKSHACGTGEEVPHEIVKIMLLLKIQSLSYGHSGGLIENKAEFVEHIASGKSVFVTIVTPFVAGRLGINNPQSAMIFGGLVGSTSGVSAGLAATDPALVPYGALTATFHTAVGCLLCPSILYFIVNAIL